MNKLTDINSCLFDAGELSDSDNQLVNLIMTEDDKDLNVIKKLLPLLKIFIFCKNKIIKYTKFPSWQLNRDNRNKYFTDDNGEFLCINNFTDNEEILCIGEYHPTDTNQKIEYLSVRELKDITTELSNQIKQLENKISNLVNILITQYGLIEPWVDVEEYMFISEKLNISLCSYSPPHGKNKNKICSDIAINNINSNKMVHQHEFRCENCFSKIGYSERLLEEYNNTTRRNMMKSANKKY